MLRRRVYDTSSFATCKSTMKSGYDEKVMTGIKPCIVQSTHATMALVTIQIQRRR